MDPILQFKANQKVAWASFGLLQHITATAAPRLVRFADIAAGANLLDVGCGTGVLALTAARSGARVTGVDLTPELIAVARENAELMRLGASWHEGDAEELPFGDGSFDVVVSQFGHMFAPRPEVAISEMLRVLKPGGTLAFSTWPPELFTGRWFALMGKYGPPMPPGVAPPPQWGEPNIVRERLGARVRDLAFSRATMLFQILSPAHYRQFVETSFGPAVRLFQTLDATEPDKAAALRSEIEALVGQYFADNTVQQDFLMTRAIKV